MTTIPAQTSLAGAPAASVADVGVALLLGEGLREPDGGEITRGEAERRKDGGTADAAGGDAGASSSSEGSTKCGGRGIGGDSGSGGGSLN